MAVEPAVVLGSSCRLADEVDAAACAAEGVRIVRRPSGGGTVVVGPGCLMWSVIVPHAEGAPPIGAIHAAMLEPLAAVLNEALNEATGDPLASPGEAPGRAAQSGPRIARRGTSDLALLDRRGGVPGATPIERKIAGTALRVRRHGVLYHGTLLDGFDLALVGRVLRHPPREPEYRGQRPHGEFLANLGLGRMRLEAAVRAAFGATNSNWAWPADRVARLVRDRYAAHDWTDRL
jgi:lipoate-protein ligase A